MANSRICSIPKCAKPQCSVEGCCRNVGLAHDANGLCSFHLRRFRRSGTVGTLYADDGAPQRFIAHAISATTDDCINWPFGLAKSGYGVFLRNRKTHAVHRHICSKVHGEPPSPRHYACHSCGNRSCVNPRHIRWGTPQENSRDMDTHGTRRQRVLTLEQVLAIRQSKDAVPILADRFGIATCTVWRLRKAEIWCGHKLT